MSAMDASSIRASLQGLEGEIFKVLSHGATPEQWAEWLKVPLEHAVARGNLDLVTKLLQAGADGSAGGRRCRGSTLQQATAPTSVARMHAYPMRASLQELGPEIFKIVSCGATSEQWAEWLKVPLEHAAARGNLGLVTTLLQAGADASAGWRGCRGRTLLDVAAVGGSADVVSSLLGEGGWAEVNVVSASSGRSALYTATTLGHEAAARRLIFAGADVNFCDPIDRCSVLHKAVRGGHEQLVNDLLPRVLYIDTWDEQWATPLHHAARQGLSNIASALLLMGASENARSLDGSTPLIWAAEEGRLGTAEILLAAGAGVVQRNDSNYSGFDVAAREGHVDILEAIVRSGWDADTRDDCGTSALHEAAGHGRMGGINFLVDEGVNVDVTCKVGTTPLYFASSDCMLEAMLALLQRGARVNQGTTHSMETPLHSMCCSLNIGAEAATDLLLRWGADETKRDSSGNTPAEVIDHPCHNRHRQCSEDEVERVRFLLAQAPADRAWRRRGWLVVLRSRAKEVSNHTPNGNNSSNSTMPASRKAKGKRAKIAKSGEAGGLTLGRRHAANNHGGGVVARVEGGLSGLVGLLIRLESENMFRAVVSFL